MSPDLPDAVGPAGFDPEFFDPDAPGARRAADAFRAALDAHAGDFAAFDSEALRSLAEGVPVRVERPTVGSRPRRRWAGVLAGVASAAAVLVVVPMVLFLVVRGGGAASTASLPMDAKAGGNAAGAAPESTQVSAPGTDAQAAPASKPLTPSYPLPAGTRWETMGDAIVAVPASWGYATALNASWCAEGAAPYRPPASAFVAYPSIRQAIPSILCPGDIPEALQAEHVEWRRGDTSDAPGDVTRNGWVYSSRLVGHSYITYVHRPGVQAGSLLDTALPVTVDANGCPVDQPGGDAARPTPVELAGPSSWVALCEYIGTTLPNLVTSRRLDASSAADLADEIEAQKAVSGPRLQSASECLPSDEDRTRIVARFSDGTLVRQVWLALGSCNLPTTDDGTTYREASRAVCLSAQQAPIVVWTWSGAVQECMPAKIGAEQPAP